MWVLVSRLELLDLGFYVDLSCSWERFFGVRVGLGVFIRIDIWGLRMKFYYFLEGDFVWFLRLVCKLVRLGVGDFDEERFRVFSKYVFRELGSRLYGIE